MERDSYSMVPDESADNATLIFIGPNPDIKTFFPRYGIVILKVRRSRDGLILNMGIPILVKRYLYMETCWRYAGTVSVLVPSHISITSL